MKMWKHTKPAFLCAATLFLVQGAFGPAIANADQEPKGVSASRAFGPDWLAAGPDWLASGPDWLAAGPDWLASGPDWLASGPDWLR